MNVSQLRRGGNGAIIWEAANHSCCPATNTFIGPIHALPKPLLWKERLAKVGERAPGKRRRRKANNISTSDKIFRQNDLLSGPNYSVSYTHLTLPTNREV